MAFRERALKIALTYDLGEHALRTYNNLANGPLQLDRFQEARDLAEPGSRWPSHEGTGLAAGPQPDDRRREPGAGPLGRDARGGRPARRSGHCSSSPVGRGSRAFMRRVETETGCGDDELAEAMEITNSEFARPPAGASNRAERQGDHQEALQGHADRRLQHRDRERGSAGGVREGGLAALAIDAGRVQRLIEFVAGLPPAMRRRCSGPAPQVRRPARRRRGDGRSPRLISRTPCASSVGSRLRSCSRRYCWSRRAAVLRRAGRRVTDAGQRGGRHLRPPAGDAVAGAGPVADDAGDGVNVACTAPARRRPDAGGASRDSHEWRWQCG